MPNKPSDQFSPAVSVVLPLATLPLVLIASLPFLQSRHRNPIPGFHSEWWAALLGLIAALCLLAPRYRKYVALPTIALLPILLALLILLQLALLPAARSEASLLAILYLLWTALLMTVTGALSGALGRDSIANALATGLALGALASVAVVSLQAADFLTGTRWVSQPNSGRLYGNLNQPNHLALQLWLGIAAIIHLRGSKQISLPTLAIALALMTFASLASGSRALWLYATGLVVTGLLIRWQCRGQKTANGTLLNGAMLALLLTLIGKFVLPLLAGGGDSGTTAPPAWLRESSDNLRGGLWWIAARMGWDNLWLGVGWGGFSRASFAGFDSYVALAPPSLLLAPGEHAHNIWLNLLAELGLAGPLLLMVTAAGWFWRAWRQIPAPATVFGITLTLLIALHAQLEYTLWYTYFLGIAAIALALAETSWRPLPNLRPQLIGVVLAASLAVLLMLNQDYRRLERAMYWQTANPSAGQSWSSVVAELLDLRRHSQFGGYIDLTLVGAMPIDANALPDKLRVCELALSFSPPDYAVFKCAALLAIDGQFLTAEALFRRGLAAYPAKAAATAGWLAPLSEHYPQLLPLLDAARRAPAI